jgi:hypothetical protein
VGDVPFGAGFDQGVAIPRIEGEIAFQFADAALQAAEHFLRFLADLGELSIGEMGDVGHEHLAVILEGQIGGARTVAMQGGAFVGLTDGTPRGHRTR